MTPVLMLLTPTEVEQLMETREFTRLIDADKPHLFPRIGDTFDAIVSEAPDVNNIHVGVVESTRTEQGVIVKFRRANRIPSVRISVAIKFMEVIPRQTAYEKTVIAHLGLENVPSQLQGLERGERLDVAGQKLEVLEVDGERVKLKRLGFAKDDRDAYYLRDLFMRRDIWE